MLYIDITRLFNHPYTGVKTHHTGVDKVTLAYIGELSSKSCAVIRYPKYWLFLDYTLSQKIFKSLLQRTLIKFNRNRWLKNVNKFRYARPVQRRGEQNYLLHTSHGGLEKPEFMQFMDKYQLKGIYFLHDLIPIDYPEYCRDGEKHRHQYRLSTMSQGELVICNSQYTLSRWQNYCHVHHMPLPTSLFAHLAPDSGWKEESLTLSPLLNFLLPPLPYFLVVGTIEARKNHLLLLNVWRQLGREMKADCPKLLIVGKRGWECEQVLDILDRSEELKNNVFELNDCSDDDLNYLMHHCQALLFPSFEEGYGLPIIEAFQSGIPVIASNIAAFEEINLDDTATLLSPIDASAWQTTIVNYCDNQSPPRLQQIQKMAIIQPSLPSWQSHFDKVLPYFDTIC